MGGFLGSFLGKLFADEFRAWLPWIQERAVRAAVRRLPCEHQERFNEEWRSHLNDVPGELAKTWVALGFLRAAKQISTRQFGLSRISVIALYVLLLPVISIVYVVVEINKRKRYQYALKTPHGDYIVFSRNNPLGTILFYSLQLDVDINRSYWDNRHYSCWRTPRLFVLEDFLQKNSLTDLVSLGYVVTGRISFRKWAEVAARNLQNMQNMDH